MKSNDFRRAQRDPLCACSLEVLFHFAPASPVSDGAQCRTGRSSQKRASVRGPAF